RRHDRHVRIVGRPGRAEDLVAGVRPPSVLRPEPLDPHAPSEPHPPALSPPNIRPPPPPGDIPAFSRPASLRSPLSCGPPPGPSRPPQEKRSRIGIGNGGARAGGDRVDAAVPAQRRGC